MAKIAVGGRFNKTLGVISTALAFGLCLLLRGKKPPKKGYANRFKKIRKHSLGLLDAIDKKLEVSKAEGEALDYARCLEIYNNKMKGSFDDKASQSV